jgi:hypothetical protein
MQIRSTKFENKNVHIESVPCHCSIAHPRLVNGGEGIQIWRVAASILDKRRGEPIRGSSPARILWD